MIVKIDCETDGSLHSTIKDVDICPTKTLGSLRGCVQYWSVSAAAPVKRSAFRTVLGPGGGTRREQPHTTDEIWGKQTDYIYVIYVYSILTKLIKKNIFMLSC